MIAIDLCHPHYQILNLSEVNNKDCKKCMKRKTIKLKCDFVEFKNNRLTYKCKECGRRCYVNELIKKFSSIYQFGGGNLNNFVLLLRKGVYPYE